MFDMTKTPLYQKNTLINEDFLSKRQVLIE
jgi:hypothetical protein